ncbi:MAG: folate-binding protein YgfZ [Rhodospirillaceae bacterium]|jgi:folate-binding protein YgfZ|nr:folate-binding protein YgfZ [Rhodospirillaceae bacterium]
MSAAKYIELPGRGVLRVSGADARGFLQGLITNDVDKLSPVLALQSAFLTPQGKYLVDFAMVELAGEILLECERARLPDFQKRLRMYKLRAKVELADASDDYRCFAVWGGDATALLGLATERGAAAKLGGGIAYVDPRLAEIGARVLLPADLGTAPLSGLGLEAGDVSAYEHLRLSLGLPDGSRDLMVDKTVLMEAGFDELNAIDWQKGCYMGQEVTARTRYRGLVKRRLVPVRLDGAAPKTGTPITEGERQVGEIRSTSGDMALAELRVDAIQAGRPLVAGDAMATPIVPDWMHLPEPAETAVSE